MTTESIRVFLVDDHKTVLWGLERLVESAAPRMVVVGRAMTCEEMLAQLRGLQPHVIVLDLDLDGVSSLDCLESIPQHCAAQVLVLTGSDDADAYHRAILGGARGVIHKQEPAEIVLRAIEKVHLGEIWLTRAALGRVVSVLGRGRGADPEAEKIARLTEKERQIIAVFVEEGGARNKIVAERLHMSEHTLRNHLTAIYDKLELSGRLELYLYATRHLQAQQARR